MTSYPCNKYEQVTPSHLLSVTHSKYIEFTRDTKYVNCSYIPMQVFEEKESFCIWEVKFPPDPFLQK